MPTVNRQSNFELYRIILMVFIIAHHYVVNSGLNLLAYGDMFSWRGQWLLQWGGYGKIGINCFVLLSSYFMCGRDISWKKWLALFAEFKFYQIGLFIFFLLWGYEQLSLHRLVELVMPFTQLETNFMGCFLVFYLMIPFLNILVSHLSQRQHLYLMSLTLLIYTILGSIPGVHITFNYVTWFCILFVIAAYIRRYNEPWFDNHRLWFWIMLVSLICCIASVAAGCWCSQKLGTIVVYSLVKDCHKIFAVTTALTSFMFFKNLRIGYSPFINWIASSVFGIFLFHTGSAAMRTWLWRDVCRCEASFHSSYLVWHSLACVAGVFLAGLLVDKMRHYIVYGIKGLFHG